MLRLKRTALALAAALCAGTGIYQATLVPPTRERRPGWAPALAPLAGAPLPAGRPVALALPVRLSRVQAESAGFEAVWLRPDVFWAGIDAWPLREPPEVVVVVGDASSPPGYAPRWQRGAIAVLARDGR